MGRALLEELAAAACGEGTKVISLASLPAMLQLSPLKHVETLAVGAEVLGAGTKVISLLASLTTVAFDETAEGAAAVLLTAFAPGALAVLLVALSAVLSSAACGSTAGRVGMEAMKAVEDPLGGIIEENW